MPGLEEKTPRAQHRFSGCKKNWEIARRTSYSYTMFGLPTPPFFHVVLVFGDGNSFAIPADRNIVSRHSCLFGQISLLCMACANSLRPPSSVSVLVDLPSARTAGPLLTHFTSTMSNPDVAEDASRACGNQMFRLDDFDWTMSNIGIGVLYTPSSVEMCRKVLQYIKLGVKCTDLTTWHERTPACA